MDELIQNQAYQPQAEPAKTQHDYEEHFNTTTTQFQSNESLRVTATMRENLLSGCKWLKFLAVMMAIGIGFLAVIGVCSFFGGIVLLSSNDVEAAEFIALGVVYIIIIPIYIYPLKKTFDLISNTRMAMQGSQNGFEEAADNFASIMKYVGIMTIVVFALYVIIIIFAIIAVVLAAMTM